MRQHRNTRIRTGRAARRGVAAAAGLLAASVLVTAGQADAGTVTQHGAAAGAVSPADGTHVQRGNGTEFVWFDVSADCGQPANTLWVGIYGNWNGPNAYIYDLSYTNNTGHILYFGEPTRMRDEGGYFDVPLDQVNPYSNETVPVNRTITDTIETAYTAMDLGGLGAWCGNGWSTTQVRGQGAA